MATKPSILEVSKKRPIIGDGSYVLTLEKRGYVKAGAWTPEAVIEHPDAGTLESMDPFFRKRLMTALYNFYFTQFLLHFHLHQICGLY